MLKCILSLCLWMMVITSNSYAVQSVNVQTFNPSTSDHFVLLEDGLKTEWPLLARYYLGANYNYVHSPFTVPDVNLSPDQSNFIDSIQSFDFFMGYKPDKQLGLYFGIPIHTVTYSDYNTFRSVTSQLHTTGSKTVMGDMKVMAKVRLNRDDDNTAWALIPEIHLPTGNTENFVSDASTYLALRASLERVFESFTLAINAGFATAANATYETMNFKNRILFGIGGFIPFTDRIGANAEYKAQIPVPFINDLNPNEFYVGLRYAALDNLIFTGGGSLARIGGTSGQDYRVIFGIRYSLLENEPEVAPVRRYVPPAEPVTAPVAVASPTPWPSPTATPVAVVAAAPIPAKPARAVMKDKSIELTEPVQFEEGSDRLTLEAKSLLEEVSDVLKPNQKSFKKIYVDGHTNNVGGTKANMILSEKRAIAVKKQLIKFGVSAKKLFARGFGEAKPKVPYSNKNAMDINRRVEFNVVK